MKLLLEGHLQKDVIYTYLWSLGLILTQKLLFGAEMDNSIVWGIGIGFLSGIGIGIVKAIFQVFGIGIVKTIF